MDPRCQTAILKENSWLSQAQSNKGAHADGEALETLAQERRNHAPRTTSTAGRPNPVLLAVHKSDAAWRRKFREVRPSDRSKGSDAACGYVGYVTTNSLGTGRIAAEADGRVRSKHDAR